MQDRKRKLGLVPRLILGIIAGILIGAFLPEVLVRVLVTFASLFAAFLKFVIPFIILAFVICGIADLTHGAGKLLGLTTGIAYGSTILAALLRSLWPVLFSRNGWARKWCAYRRSQCRDGRSVFYHPVGTDV